MNQSKFLEWYFDRFPFDQNLNTILINLIWYVNTHFHSKDAIPHFLADILDDVTFEEICVFCSDEVLTDYGKKCKANALTPEQNNLCETCYLAMHNCHDMGICCESEEYDGERCDWFEPMPAVDRRNL